MSNFNPSKRPLRRPPPEPSHKEINAKLKLFLQQLAADEVPLADPDKFRRDQELLGLNSTYEVLALIHAMKDEIKAEHYCPPHVRKKSYDLGDAPMYDFAWESAHRAERMYLKFAVVSEQSYLV